jgi:hypothetical protein
MVENPWDRFTSSVCSADKDGPISCLRCGLVGFLLLVLASSGQALSTTFGDIEITLGPAPKGTSSHGYFEYVFHVVNNSTDRPHLVTLSIPAEKHFLPGDSIRELRRTVQVGPKETALLSLLQPDHPPIHGADVAVTIDGRRQEREIIFKPNESLRRYYSRPGYLTSFSPTPLAPLILLSARAARDIQAHPLQWGDFLKSSPTPAAPPRGAAMPPGAKAPPPSKPGLPSGAYQFAMAETWSSNWLAYSRYDGIVVTAEELNTLPAEVRTALWQYVETGGALLVLGKTDLRGLSAVSETKKDGGWLGVWAGFGICRVSPDTNYDTWDDKCFAWLADDWKNTTAIWSSTQRNTFQANEECPVIDDLGIPVKGLFVLMILFSLGIGPINIWVLSRLKRRIWLLWTTPVFSFCTCVAVFGYMLISEGWSGQLRSEALTLLDEATHRATTIGWTGVYSPLTPADGLHFRYETEVIPQRFFEGLEGGARSCILDWSQDQHFAAGWVEARVPALFKVRKSELRRERIALHLEGDGRWSMVNGLGAAIRRFWYADAKGQIHAAEDIAAGARTMLKLTEKECPAAPVTFQSVLASVSWMAKMKDLAEHPQNYLRPGLYLAEMDETPFLEEPLRSAQKRNLHALVVGFSQQGEKQE